MISAKRAVMRSLQATKTPEATAHRHDEIAAAPPLKRSGLMVVDRLVSLRPKALATALSIDYQPPGLVLLATRPATKVYSREGTGDVIKVNLPSMRLTEAERVRQRDKMLEEHKLLAKYLGKSVVDQEIFIGRHPIASSQRAIQTVQARRQVDYMHLFSEGSSELDMAQLDFMASQHPATYMLPFLIAGSLRLYENEGLILDTNGPNNIGVDRVTRELIVTDGQPVDADTPEHLAVQEIILEQHARLWSALEVVL